jgi:hypothetical protein
VELAYPYNHLLSGPLGVSKRLIVSEQLEEHKPKEHKQLPKRSWLDIIVLILAASMSNTVTYKILTKVIYRADFGSITNLLPPP